MKLQSFFLLLTIVFIGNSFSACEKDNSTSTTTTTSSPYYINFDLDGVAQEYGTTQAGTAGGSYSSPLGFPHSNHYTGSSVTNSSTFINVEIDLYFGKDSIVEADLMSLVGQQLPIGECSPVGCKAASMCIYKLGGGGVELCSASSGNSSASDFVQIDAVTYLSTGLFGLKVFEVSGSFNVQLYGNNGTQTNVSQAATNGTFKLLFPEVKS